MLAWPGKGCDEDAQRKLRDDLQTAAMLSQTYGCVPKQHDDWMRQDVVTPGSALYRLKRFEVFTSVAQCSETRIRAADPKSDEAEVEEYI
nr:hypothetical protein CFP56_79026 [Quercus suber]